MTSLHAKLDFYAFLSFGLQVDSSFVMFTVPLMMIVIGMFGKMIHLKMSTLPVTNICIFINDDVKP